ncbi:MAG: biopolymer transporter ExbD [Zetaproteobacteria bacterium]|nr:biopolymer transporter ExbD [Zetaproteobacteria bacterium]
MIGFDDGHDTEADIGEYADLAEINIVPLVDIMLVLLVVFMVAAPLSISGIQVKLPESNAGGQAAAEGPVILSIDAQGSFFLDKLKVPEQELEGRLQAIFKSREQKSLYIRADKQVIYFHVVDAMTAAKKAGVRKLSVLTKPLSAAL